MASTTKKPAATKGHAPRNTRKTVSLSDKNRKVDERYRKNPRLLVALTVAGLGAELAHDAELYGTFTPRATAIVSSFVRRLKLTDKLVAELLTELSLARIAPGVDKRVARELSRLATRNPVTRLCDCIPCRRREEEAEAAAERR